MSIKNTASGERLFRLRGCSEDDTILNGKLMYLFGVLKETYWRMFHPMTVPVGAGAVFIYFIVEGYILHMAHDFL